MGCPAIIVIAYNRAASLMRLLTSLDRAVYPKDKKVPLLISIDKGDNDDVIEAAEGFNWRFGRKTVIKHNENLGLKAHVLECGEYVNSFDEIIVLEDDLYVAPSFYKYARKALEFTADDERTGGVSLYSHRLNVHVREPFEAIDDGYDNWYFQFASSWGQAYTKKQWNGFKEWYLLNGDMDLRSHDFPENVALWSDSSWLKYYIKYLVETDKYFMYPRVSYTTNFTEEGTNEKSSACDFQVPLAGIVSRRFNFSRLDESRAVYDSFFENTAIDGKYTDLYGYKEIPEGRESFLSGAHHPYEVIRSYGRKLRPIDANIINDVEGNDFFLYDLTKSARAPKGNDASKVMYNNRALKAREMISVLKYRIGKRS